MQNEDTENDKDKEHNLSVWPLCAISNQLCFVSNGFFLQGAQLKRIYRCDELKRF